MNIKHVRDMKTPLKVVAVYIVESILVYHYWWPMLDEHVGDITGENHFHFDTRFFGPNELEKMIELGAPKNISYSEILAGPVEKITARCPMSWRCHRNFGASDVKKTQNWHNLQEKVKEQGCVLDLKCKICPHQGLNLKTVRPVKIDGQKAIVCPNHHLAWSAIDGSLIERY